MSVGEFTSVLGVLGGIALFCWALYEWRDAQQWKRADKLETFIREFDSDKQLLRGRVVLDWKWRTVDIGDTKVTVTNDEALLALRVHTQFANAAESRYSAEQTQIRDALDAILGFFDRLCLAVSARLVDGDHARRYFRYWLCKLVTYESHPVEQDTAPAAKAGGTPAARIAEYIAAYGNMEMVMSLCKVFGVRPPPEVADRAERAAREQPSHYIEPEIERAM
jgi:hypothetical protein